MYGKVKEIDITLLNYDELFKNSIGWSGYHFVMMMGLKTCPYCNRQYITPAFHEKDGCVRADLDHFYPKSKYPYLSMSIYNLVPCCKFCNSSLKLNKEFTYETHLHPYEAGYEDLLKFSFKSKSYDLSSIKTEDIEVILKKNQKLTGTSKDNLDKAEKNACVFKIETLYNYHSDDVVDLILKRVAYSEEYIDDLKKLLEGIKGRLIPDNEIMEFLLSNYKSDKKRLHERIFAFLWSLVSKVLAIRVFYQG